MPGDYVKETFAFVGAGSASSPSLRHLHKTDYAMDALPWRCYFGTGIAVDYAPTLMLIKAS